MSLFLFSKRMQSLLLVLSILVGSISAWGPFSSRRSKATSQGTTKYADVDMNVACEVGGGATWIPANGDCMMNCSTSNSFVGLTREGQPSGCRLSVLSLDQHCSEGKGYSNMQCDRATSYEHCRRRFWNWRIFHWWHDSCEDDYGVMCKCNSGFCRLGGSSKKCVAKSSEEWTKYRKDEIETRRAALREKYRTATRDTGDTCTWTDCDDTRGATRCSDGKCLCQPDHCAINGTCYAIDDIRQSPFWTDLQKSPCLEQQPEKPKHWENPCERMWASVGSCKFTGCSAGSSSECSWLRGLNCYCEEGYCAVWDRNPGEDKGGKCVRRELV